MKPKSDKNKRRDSKMRYHGYPYANKKPYRKIVARQARRRQVTSNKEYRVLGAYTVQDIW
jgi:hypothetical protein